MLRFLTRNIDLTPDETRTFRFIMASSVFTGIVQAVWTIIPEIARNTLKAEDYYISIITMIGPIGQLFAVYWSAYMDGRADKSKALILAGLFGRFPIIFGALFDQVLPILFFAVFLVIASPAVTAAQHSIVQSNFRQEVRGKLFSYSISTLTLTSLVSVVLAGLWLDANGENYRFVLIITGVAALLETVFLARIDVKNPLEGVFHNLSERRFPWRDWVLHPWRDFYRLMKEDRAFLKYEINFFVYGMGFMILQPFLTLFLVNDLQLNYTHISIAKGSITQAGVFLLAPYAGRLLDRMNPVLYAAYAFLLIALHPLALIFTGLGDWKHPEWMVYFSYAILCLGWAAVIIVWNLGHIFFAGKRDVARYSGAHVVMVGLRGALALMITVFLVRLVSPLAGFAICLALWLAASWLMFHQWLRDYRMKPIDKPFLPKR